TYRWELQDGSAEGETASRTLTSAGEHPVRLIVADGDGRADTATTVVTVGNTPPQVAVQVEGNRSFFWPGSPLQYGVQASDAEDGDLGAGIEPERVRLTVDYQQRALLEATALGHQTEQTPAG